MKALLIDAGNSRIKWCVFRNGRIGASRAMAWKPGNVNAVALRVMRHGADADVVLVCSVAGNGVVRALQGAARLKRTVKPRFIRSQRRVAGVTNGYRQPWRLGVDRWVAMIGAHAQFPRRHLCIVDVGTAMTVDLVDAEGLHRGGVIVPGPRLMTDALLVNTAQIRRRAGRAHGGAVPRRLFAASTRAALRAGAVHAAAGLIDRSLQEAGRLLGGRPALLLAGGGAGDVAPLIDGHSRRADDLVLRGLSVLARIEAG